MAHILANKNKRRRELHNIGPMHTCRGTHFRLMSFIVDRRLCISVLVL